MISSRVRDRLGWLSSGSLIVVVLLAPALWNAFPLIWADTGGYLARPFERTLEIGRSALYGAFVAAGVPFDFWPGIALQAAITAWVLALILRAFGLGGRPWFAAVLVLGLALTTSLPWYVSQLMPDIFVPLAVLALYLLGFQGGILRRWERAALFALIAFAIASHMAILGLCAALTVAFAGLRLLIARFRLPMPELRWTLGAVGAGIMLALASNAIITGQLAFTPGGAHFVFGRLVQDGIVARYLAERCPDTTLRLCAYRDQLPASADGWMWGWDSPLYKLGGPESYEPEARRIIAATLTMYPGEHLRTAARAALQQFVMFRTGEGINPHDTEHAVRALDRYAPRVMPRFNAARQQRDQFDFTWINAIHLPVAFIALGLLPIIIAAGFLGRIEPSGAVLALTVLLALLTNAAISGVLSNQNDRYQSRVVWLAPLAVMLVGWNLWRSKPNA